MKNNTNIDKEVLSAAVELFDADSNFTDKWLEKPNLFLAENSPKIIF